LRSRFSSSAAQLIVAWSHRGRLRSEACFARLAGVAPIPASSGQTQRHRLSRGGDRQLNRALHTIVLHRRQHDAATQDYIARRIAEGKSRRDATRPLKRYLARHLYRLLQHTEPLMVTQWLLEGDDSGRPLAERSTVTAPAPHGRARADSGAHGIADHIGDSGEEMLVFFHQDCPVAPLER
jgi:Transposase IS116/IS110/IS902 family